MKNTCHSELVSESKDMTDLPPHPSPLPQGARERTRVAFTLAEVLITLGIIGVVAAMTIPNLMANYQHKRLKSQFSKMYSQLKQLEYKFQSEGIACTTNDASSNVYEGELFRQFLLENIKTAGEIELSQKPYKTFKTYTLKDTNMKIYPNCLEDSQTMIENHHIYNLLDGTTLAICRHVWHGHLVSIDINGYNNKPNAFGHDLFFFNFNRDTCKLVPMSFQWRVFTDDDSEEDKASSTWGMNTPGACSKYSTQGENGFACGEWAIKDKNPDGLAKGYWETLPR